MTQPNLLPNCNWTLVVAVAQNGVIGQGNELPWKISSDLKRFKAMTMGHCLLMGRKTYQSIGRPLPGRQTIVLSGSGFETEHDAVKVVETLDDVAPQVEPGRQVMVVGGSHLYQTCLDRCQTIWLTRVLAEVAGDVFFPPIDWSAWKLQQEERIEAGPKDDFDSLFQIWHRVEASV